MNAIASGSKRTVLFWTEAFILCSLALAQGLSERETVLHALGLSYRHLAGKQPVFELNSDHFLTPIFSTDGILLEISIEPKSPPGIGNAVPISRSKFDLIMANLQSIKPLGAIQESMDAGFVHGGRAWGSLRYERGYMRLAEQLGVGAPRPIVAARIYYLHQVTGIGSTPRDSRPGTCFGLVCMNGEVYIAPKSEFLKLWSMPGKQQVVDLAGPTEDTLPDCKK